MPNELFTLRGKKIDADAPVRIFMAPGVAILGDGGEHLEGGRHHTIRYALALELVQSNRARFAAEAADAPAAAADDAKSEPRAKSKRTR